MDLSDISSPFVTSRKPFKCSWMLGMYLSFPLFIYIGILSLSAYSLYVTPDMAHVQMCCFQGSYLICWAVYLIRYRKQKHSELAKGKAFKMSLEAHQRQCDGGHPPSAHNDAWADNLETAHNRQVAMVGWMSWHHTSVEATKNLWIVFAELFLALSSTTTTPLMWGGFIVGLLKIIVVDIGGIEAESCLKDANMDGDQF